MKYTHYAPKAEMTILQGPHEKVEEEILRRKVQAEAEGRKVGVLLFGEEELAEAAHDFFACLREMDDQGVDLILAGALSYGDGVGFAVMNRMLKSAGYHVISVES
ncbi:MAG: threonylcarbamoyl-AMP synthase, partial [Clostridiales bacterium]|nr:threonylcarbamoyl-AMP synthase [Clostridiales bacterium]